MFQNFALAFNRQRSVNGDTVKFHARLFQRKMTKAQMRRWNGIWWRRTGIKERRLINTAAIKRTKP
jgi:hypothetical protein